MKHIICEPSEKELFTIMKKYDNMTLLDAVYQYYMNKKQEYLKQHNHKIWQNEKKGRWYSYFDDESKRKFSLKSRSTLDEMEKLVIQYYRNIEKAPTFYQVFHMWNNERYEFREISPQTFSKYETDFQRFFKQAPFRHKKIKNIEMYELETYIKKTIRDFDLTNKSYAGMRTIIRGMFKYAKRRSFTDLSITTFFGDLDLSRKIFKPRIIRSEEEVFTEEEVKQIVEYLKGSKTIRDYGLLLAFQTGLRVGELAGLKKVDVGIYGIHVCRTEVNYKEPHSKKRVCEVRDFPKTEAGDRHLLVPKIAVNTVQTLIELSDSTSEYLFSEKGKRIRANALNRRLSRVCNILGMRKRSMHKVRKTYGTTLIDANVDESTIIEMMGHKDISTTKKYYYFSNKNVTKKQEQIDKAFMC